MQEDLIKILENAPLSKPIDIEPLRHRARVSQTVNRVLTAPIFKKGVGFPQVGWGGLVGVLNTNGVRRDKQGRLNAIESIALTSLGEGVDGNDISKIEKSLALAEKVIVKDDNFSLQFLETVVQKLLFFRSNLLGSNGKESVDKVLTMIDIIMGLAQRRVETKAKITEDELGVYITIAEIKAVVFYDLRGALEFLDTAIERGSCEAYLKKGALLESKEETIEEALVVYKLGWEKYGDTSCILARIGLLIRLFREQEAQREFLIYKATGEGTLSWSELLLSNTKGPIRYDDIASIIPGSHIRADRYIIPEVLSSVADGLDEKLSRIQNILSDDNLSPYQKEAFSIELLILLQNGVIGLLNKKYVELFFETMEEILKLPRGQDLLVGFFETHELEYVPHIVSTPEFTGDVNHVGIYTSTAITIINTFNYLFYNHFSFDGREDLSGYYRRAQDILGYMGFDKKEYLDAFSASMSALFQFDELFDVFPKKQQDYLSSLWEKAIALNGEFFLRKNFRNLLMGTAMIFPKASQDIVVIFATVCFFFKSVETVDSLLENMDFSPFSKEQIGLLVQALYYGGHYDQSANLILHHGNMQDEEQLDILMSIIFSLKAPLLDLVETHLKEENMGETLSGYFAQLIEDGDFSPLRSHLLARALWAELRYKPERNTGKHIERIKGLFNSAHEGMYTTMSSASTSEERDTRKKDFIDIAVTSAAFRMDIDEKAEAYSLLQLLKKSNTHPKISQYLADIAISLGKREEAHEYLTLMDKEGNPNATSLWIEYYISCSSKHHRLNGLQTALTSEDTHNPEYPHITTARLLEHARKMYQSTSLSRSGEENLERLQLLHYLSIDLEQNIDHSIQYWKTLGKYIEEDDIDLLNVHFTKFVHPDDHDIIVPKMGDTMYAIHTLLMNLQHQSVVFGRVFEQSERFEELCIAIADTFSLVPGGLGAGFAEDRIHTMREKSGENLLMAHGVQGNISTMLH